jgi:hypothetical protein
MSESQSQQVLTLARSVKSSAIALLGKMVVLARKFSNA